jgi:predicted nicotinamide N-methyase
LEVVTRAVHQCSRRLETHRCPAGVMGPRASSVRARRRAALVAYLQMAPAAEVIDACRRCEDPGENEGAESSSPHSSSSFDDVAQDALHRCVTHPIATSHPPTKAYIARLLKLATIEAERGGQTLNDLLVGHLVQQTFLQDGTDDGWCHKTYAYGELLQGSDTDDDDTEDGDVLANRRTVSFRMHRNLFEGGTGCHEWHAGFYLAELAATHPKIFDGRTVLELGSGVGLAATVMARGGTKATSPQQGCRGVPSRLILTDADADALVNLTANLAANDVAVGGENTNPNDIDGGRTKQNAVHVTTARLDWEDFHEDTLRTYRTDLIVASDVLYDPLNITPLLNVCGCLLGVDEESFGDGDGDDQNHNHDRSHIPGDDESAPACSWVDDVANNRRAVFVTTLRQPETLAKFETEARARGFDPKDVTADVFDVIGADGLFASVRGLDRWEMRVHVLRPPRVG